jgi:hypothetical protein
VRIGLAGKGSLLKNCGVGWRERRFYDTDGSVYVLRDRAYYCPDASYPIMSVGEWEDRDATVIFNPSSRFRKTENGKMLPKDGKMALIVDSAERMICLKKVEGVEHLHWLVPIQPTTVEDVESKKIAAHNQVFAANMLRQLDKAADAPTVEEYSTKVQALQGQLEEAHLLHSQLFGASQEDVKALIASAYETIASIPSSSECDRSGFNSIDTPTPYHLLAHASTLLKCSRCMEAECDGSTCTSACYICLAPTGHESTCDMANVATTRLPVLQDAALASAATTGTGEAEEHSEEPFHGWTPRLPTSIVAQACASLQVVQQGVLEVLEQQPQIGIEEAVYSVVMSLAAHDDPSILSAVGSVQPTPPSSSQSCPKRDNSSMLHTS